MHLKQRLQALKKEKDCGTPGDNLIGEMLSNVGSIDSELRDELIYSTFAEWIYNNKITSRQFRTMLHTCLDENHLFFSIGDTSSDSVFTRSFSSLLIAALMTRDRDLMLLSQKEIEDVINKAILYMNSEKDTRGFVEGKGWAHAIAHGADLLDACVKHPEYDSSNHKTALDAISSCLFPGVTYIDDEDERLAAVVNSLLDKGISCDVLESWINSISARLEEVHSTEGYSLTFFRTKTNVLNLYKTLYFSLQSENIQIREQIEDQIRYWNNKMS
ncbi:DUF2785 domain-containing protein [Alteribacter natronophilus]|uniref:DUF2785 domain-containing protein n=1 Tax=Alteribacter natronophilus TaxID=2583810 RepID=UPI00110E89A5|nr:DUF2785 domain-containing protein [Alteribacter natronophilus]TMW71201.1 DUF2785 domain-containing protein [Alteribacter natronophilus]